MRVTEQVLSIRRNDLSWTPTDTESIVILDLRTSTYLQLNNAGAQLWTRLYDGAVESDLVTGLISAYGVDRATAERDVATFLASLRARDLLSKTE